MRITKTSNDFVWSQFLKEGFLIVTEADVLEVLDVAVVGEHVECTLECLDGSRFDRCYPLDYLIPTEPRDGSRLAA